MELTAEQRFCYRVCSSDFVRPGPDPGFRGLVARAPTLPKLLRFTAQPDVFTGYSARRFRHPVLSFISFGPPISSPQSRWETLQYGPRNYRECCMANLLTDTRLIFSTLAFVEVPRAFAGRHPLHKGVVLVGVLEDVQLDGAHSPEKMDRAAHLRVHVLDE